MKKESVCIILLKVIIKLIWPEYLLAKKSAKGPTTEKAIPYPLGELQEYPKSGG